MNESGSKFVVNGERSRDPRDGARQSGPSAADGRSLPASAKSLRPEVARRRPARGGYAVGVLAVAFLSVAAFVFGRLRASSLPEPAGVPQPVPEAAASASVEPEAPPPAPLRRELALIPFVPIEVEPANGEIWLDREVAGVGAVQLGAINDGMLHELKFVAPDHETKTLFFRNTPPAGRVILKRIVREPAVAAKAAPRKARGGPSAASPPAARPPVMHAAVSDASTATKKAPRVEVIEVHMPRV